jgi:hypothetical protein
MGMGACIFVVAVAFLVLVFPLLVFVACGALAGRLLTRSCGGRAPSIHSLSESTNSRKPVFTFAILMRWDRGKAALRTPISVVGNTICNAPG